MCFRGGEARAVSLACVMEDSQCLEDGLQCAYWQLAPPAQVRTVYIAINTKHSSAQLSRPLVNPECACSSAVGRASATTGQWQSQRSRSASVFNLLSSTRHIPPWQCLLQVCTSVSAPPPAPP